MKKLFILMLIGLLILTGCGGVSKVSEFTELVEDVEKEVNEKVEEATKEAEKLVEETKAAEAEVATETDTTAEEVETPETEEGLRDTSNAIIIEDAKLYEGSIEAGGQIEYLVQAGAADYFNVLVKASNALVGQFKEVREDENANNGFNIYSDKGIFNKFCDGPELFYLKNESDQAIDYAFVGLIGNEEDLKVVIDEIGGLTLPSEINGGFDQATFLIGDTGIYINGVKAYAENVEMGYPMYDGRMYLEFAGTMNNNGSEEITFSNNVVVEVYNIYGEMMTNAEKWLEDAGTKDKVANGGSVDFKQLFLMDMVGDWITVVIKNRDNGARNSFLVEVGEMVSDVAVEQEAAADATQEMIQRLAEGFINALFEDDYETVASYGDYITISSIYEAEVAEYRKEVENFLWLDSVNDESIYTFGSLEDGSIIEMANLEFYDTYLRVPAYMDMIPEVVKTTRDGKQAFEWINPAYTNYYAKYESGDRVLYLMFEEIDTDVFMLIGIRVK